MMSGIPNVSVVYNKESFFFLIYKWFSKRELIKKEAKLVCAGCQSNALAEPKEAESKDLADC